MSLENFLDKANRNECSDSEQIWLKELLINGIIYQSHYGYRLVLGRGNADKTHLEISFFL